MELVIRNSNGERVLRSKQNYQDVIGSSGGTAEASDSNNRGIRLVDTQSNIKGLKEKVDAKKSNELIHAISKGRNLPSSNVQDYD